MERDNFGIDGQSLTSSELLPEQFGRAALPAAGTEHANVHFNVPVAVRGSHETAVFDVLRRQVRGQPGDTSPMSRHGHERRGELGRERCLQVTNSQFVVMSANDAAEPGFLAVGEIRDRLDAGSITGSIQPPFWLAAGIRRHERTVTIQMGGYGEHQATTVQVGATRHKVDAPCFEVRLAPGAGQTLTIGVRRYVNQPTLTFPWRR